MSYLSPAYEDGVDSVLNVLLDDPVVAIVGDVIQSSSQRSNEFSDSNSPSLSEKSVESLEWFE